MSSDTTRDDRSVVVLITLLILCVGWARRVAVGVPGARRAALQLQRAMKEMDPVRSYGCGGDDGSEKMWKRREISVSSYYDPSHHLPPHAYMQLQLPGHPLPEIVNPEMRHGARG
jgi:hypothetical protein